MSIQKGAYKHTEAAEAVFSVGESLYGKTGSGFVHGGNPAFDVCSTNDMLSEKKKYTPADAFSNMVYDADEVLDDVNLMDETWEFSVLYDPKSGKGSVLRTSDGGLTNKEVMSAYADNPDKLVVTYNAVSNTMKVIVHDGKNISGIRYRKQKLTSEQRAVRKIVKVGSTYSVGGKTIRVDRMINDPYTGGVRVQGSLVSGARSSPSGTGIYEYSGAELMRLAGGK